ncbi:MAG: hypothetical protein NC548_32285 [Lachnospiraceae bacterium]|nr:hypothetical protein [Lachnospiraceae bacterium]
MPTMLPDDVMEKILTPLASSVLGAYWLRGNPLVLIINRSTGATIPFMAIAENPMQPATVFTSSQTQTSSLNPVRDGSTLKLVNKVEAIRNNMPTLQLRLETGLPYFTKFYNELGTMISRFTGIYLIGLGDQIIVQTMKALTDYMVPGRETAFSIIHWNGLVWLNATFDSFACQTLCNDQQQTYLRVQATARYMMSYDVNRLFNGGNA